MIGCGSFARLCHGPAQAKLGASGADLELAACCDADIGRARKYGADFGFARSYSDSGEMLSVEKPGAVVLAVPPEATCRAAALVLERGFPLLLEKPPGLNPEELGRLIAASARGGAGAQVAFNRRHMPVIRRAMEVLGASFRPESVSRIDYEMVRYARWDADFSTTAVHAIDAALFLARSPFRSAELRFQAQASAGAEAANVSVIAECACATEVRLGILPVSGANMESARIHGLGQSLSIVIPMSPQSKGDGCVEHWRSDSLVSSFSDREAGAVDRMGVLAETGAFLGAVRSGAKFSPGLEDCRQQVALMDAIRSRRAGPIQFEAR
jgi:myo-inositol 2-dehydrogenase / D-chiro-inositol 1-dehydrogenase